MVEELCARNNGPASNLLTADEVQRLQDKIAQLERDNAALRMTGKRSPLDEEYERHLASVGTTVNKLKQQVRCAFRCSVLFSYFCNFFLSFRLSFSFFFPVWPGPG
jgi:hypothetical protein